MKTVLAALLLVLSGGMFSADLKAQEVLQFDNDAQRELYAAQQNLISLQLTEQSNRIALYRVLGGGITE